METATRRLIINFIFDFTTVYITSMFNMQTFEIKSD